MKEILNHIYFGNAVKTYIYVFLAILLGILIKKYLSKLFANIMYKLVLKAGKSVNKNSFFSLVINPLQTFILLFICYVAIDNLHFPNLIDFNIFNFTTRQILHSFANGALVVAFIWLCLRMIDFAALILEEKANLTHDTTDDQLIIFFKDFFKVIVTIIGILLVLRFSFNRDITNLVTGLGIVGAVIALATKESLENLIASFVIFFDKPFSLGDVVKINNFTGTIEKIGLRSTRLRTNHKTIVTVPNKQMVDSIIENISLRTHRREEVVLEINITATSQNLINIQNNLNTFLSTKNDVLEYDVQIKEVGKNVHILKLEYLCDVTQPMQVFLKIKQEINLKAVSILQNENALIPQISI